MEAFQRLPYYELQEGDDSGSMGRYVAWKDHPELRVSYLSLDAAKAATEAVLARVLESFHRQIAEYNTRAEPDAARRGYENEKRHACQSETRIDRAEVVWEELNPRYLRGGAEAHLRLLVSTRHRYRESVMKTVVAKDGTTTITHQLGKPGPWSPWDLSSGGGLYLPHVVVVRVHARHLDLACSPDELATWVEAAKGGA